MPAPQRTYQDSRSTDSTTHAWWKTALKALAAAAGLKYGFDFGMALGSVLLGVIVALNAAAFCYLMMASVTGLMQRRQRPDSPGAASSPEQTEDQRIRP
jgi:uncharacterized protein (DUF2062 family)